MLKVVWFARFPPRMFKDEADTSPLWGAIVDERVVKEGERELAGV